MRERRIIVFQVQHCGWLTGEDRLPLLVMQGSVMLAR